MDCFVKEKRSAVMRAVKSSNTSIEKTLVEALRLANIKGWSQFSNILGKPDIVFPQAKLVIFVDGELWHGYKWREQEKTIKSNRDYWIPKIERNIKRDRKVNRRLKEAGWSVLRLWEHEIRSDITYCLEKVIRALSEKSR